MQVMPGIYYENMSVPAALPCRFSLEEEGSETVLATLSHHPDDATQRHDAVSGGLDCQNPASVSQIQIETSTFLNPISNSSTTKPTR
jgi:hypothetical protein